MSVILLPPDSPAPLPVAPLPSMTFEQFLEWLDEDTRAEWVDGEVAIIMSSSRWHQEIVRFLTMLLGLWAEAHGGVVLPAPFLMLLAEREAGGTRRGRGREPDLLYVAPENAGRIQDQYVDGPADIVVEIISPESRKTDLNAKYFEYEKAGVREYWIVDLEDEEVAFHRRNDAGEFRRVEPENGLYRSDVLKGFLLDTAWLWQRPLPATRGIVQGWPEAAETPRAPALEAE